MKTLDAKDLNDRADLDYNFEKFDSNLVNFGSKYNTGKLRK